jgi:putative FmdB family regulatory protein
MPTYDYRCNTCGKKFEWFQSITSEPLTQCPVEACQSDDEAMRGKGGVQRIVSGGAGLVFKGEGFYLTDYARKDASKRERDSEGRGKPGGASGKETASKDRNTSAKGRPGESNSGSGASDSGDTGSGTSGTSSGSEQKSSSDD